MNTPSSIKKEEDYVRIDLSAMPVSTEQYVAMILQDIYPKLCDIVNNNTDRAVVISVYDKNDSDKNEIQLTGSASNIYDAIIGSLYKHIGICANNEHERNVMLDYAIGKLLAEKEKPYF